MRGTASAPSPDPATVATSAARPVLRGRDVAHTLGSVNARIALPLALCAAACGLGPAVPAASGATVTNGAWSFVSEPTLAPPAIAAPVGHPAPVPASVEGGVASGGPERGAGDLFLAPIKDFNHRAPFIGKPGPEILEANGSPVWEHPLGEPIKVGSATYSKVAMDFHPSTYEGKPVLVWWEGYVTPNGLGNGEWEIVNQHYQAVGKITAPPGYLMDFHELRITPAGTAYVLAARVENLSLHCCGGPANGQIYDQVVLEVRIKTGQVVWHWDPLAHVPLRDSYEAIPSGMPWDPYHLNSIALGPAGNLIVSARNTWAAYWINRVTSHGDGSIFATLGGRHSSFKLGPGAPFAWQHDVRQEGSDVSLFDDEAAPTVGKHSRGLLLALDLTHHTANVAHEYLLPQPALAGSQGNVEPLAGGNVFVGWGELPYFTEYSAAGHLLYEGQLPVPDESYRTFRASWSGAPTLPPAIAARAAAGATDVYASWNGATQVAFWRLLAGAQPSALVPSGGAVARQEFETLLQSTNAGPYYAVQALDSSGGLLGTSQTVTAAGQSARSAPRSAS